MSTDKPINIKLLVIISVPFILIGIGVIYYFNGGNEEVEKKNEKIEKVERVSVMGNDAIVDPEIRDSSKILESKSEIYDREEEETRQSEKNKEKVISDNDFFGGDGSSEKEKMKQKIIKEYEFDFNDKNQESEVKEVKPSRKENNEGLVSYKSSSNTKKPVSKKTASGVTKSNGMLVSNASKGEMMKKHYADEIESEPEQKDEKEVKKDPVNDEERRGFYTANRKDNVSHVSGTEKNNELRSDEYIKCVIHNEQLLRQGNKVNLRIIEKCQIKGKDIPANTYISGTVSFQTERMLVRVSSIKLNDEIIYANFNVYENDGQLGMHAPGAMSQQDLKDAVQAANSNSQTKFNVPVVGSMQTNAIARRINDNSIRVQNNYKLLLKYEN